MRRDHDGIICALLETLTRGPPNEIFHLKATAEQALYQVQLDMGTTGEKVTATAGLEDATKAALDFEYLMKGSTDGKAFGKAALSLHDEHVLLLESEWDFEGVQSKYDAFLDQVLEETVVKAVPVLHERLEATRLALQVFASEMAQTSIGFQREVLENDEIVAPIVSGLAEAFRPFHPTIREFAAKFGELL